MNVRVTVSVLVLFVVFFPSYFECCVRQELEEKQVYACVCVRICVSVCMCVCVCVCIHAHVPAFYLYMCKCIE